MVQYTIKSHFYGGHLPRQPTPVKFASWGHDGDFLRQRIVWARTTKDIKRLCSRDADPQAQCLSLSADGDGLCCQHIVVGADARKNRCCIAESTSSVSGEVPTSDPSVLCAVPRAYGSATAAFDWVHAQKTYRTTRNALLKPSMLSRSRFSQEKLAAVQAVGGGESRPSGARRWRRSMRCAAAGRLLPGGDNLI